MPPARRAADRQECRKSPERLFVGLPARDPDVQRVGFGRPAVGVGQVTGSLGRRHLGDGDVPGRGQVGLAGPGAAGAGGGEPDEVPVPRRIHGGPFRDDDWWGRKVPSPHRALVATRIARARCAHIWTFRGDRLQPVPPLQSECGDEHPDPVVHGRRYVHLVEGHRLHDGTSRAAARRPLGPQALIAARAAPSRLRRPCTGVNSHTNDANGP